VCAPNKWNPFESIDKDQPVIAFPDEEIKCMGLLKGSSLAPYESGSDIFTFGSEPYFRFNPKLPRNIIAVVDLMSPVKLSWADIIDKRINLSIGRQVKFFI
jgi:hypothetical protein